MKEDVTIQNFIEAYKEGRINKNRLNLIKGKYREVKRLEGILIERPECECEILKHIKEVKYRLKKRLEDIYNVHKEYIELKDRKVLTAKESAAFAKECGHRISITTLYKYAKEGKIKVYYNDPGSIVFIPSDVIRLCNTIADIKKEKEKKVIRNKARGFDDEALIREIKERGYEVISK